jgi:uncharacterized Tic20 family protein
MRIRQEQLVSALCHLFNAVPLWGLLFCGWVWFALREESRFVVRNARQAMMFHGLMMAGLLIWMMLEWFSRIIGVLSPALSSLLSQLNNLIVTIFLLSYVAICLAGSARCYSGRPFRYPLVGRRP